MRAVWLGVIGLLISGACYGQIVLPTPDQFFFGVQPQAQRAPRLPAPLSEARKNAIVVPFKKALTDCVADTSNTDFEAVKAYQEGRFNTYVTGLISRCPEQAGALIAKYDETYGRGEGADFIHGAYSVDLPRAVLARTEKRLNIRLAAYTKAKAIEQAEADARAAREFRERKAEEARQEEIAQRQAEERQAALAKAEADRKTAEADRAAAEAKTAAEKRERIEVARRSFGILRDKFYDCVDGQLPGLVKSGENADSLAGASMTICRRTLSDLQDAALDQFALQEGTRPTGIAEDTFRERIKSTVRERVVADAVQAKAGVGMFAPK